ncbi:hypothetical protein [Antrihabitans cavernicola]|uniref:N-acetyltransferase domain-containing protein n=1 Tax=Antrihabitans cavernicola TaxID=2495913 RepID=A0A5A7SE60_9NOCA|nr:hypothetical protein [Spelaeibacter cavernicola]KAA0023864.1 hypothetical protein FOY51_04545 [Spelaeibacter cavernicola]
MSAGTSDGTLAVARRIAFLKMLRHQGRVLSFLYILDARLVGDVVAVADHGTGTADLMIWILTSARGAELLRAVVKSMIVALVAEFSWVRRISVSVNSGDDVLRDVLVSLGFAHEGWAPPRRDEFTRVNSGIAAEPREMWTLLDFERTRPDRNPS